MVEFCEAHVLLLLHAQNCILPRKALPLIRPASQALAIDASVWYTLSAYPKTSILAQKPDVEQ